MVPPNLLLVDDKLRERVSGWPCSGWSTRKLIRDGDLKALKIGRRYYVTAELLHDFVTARVAKTSAPRAA